MLILEDPVYLIQNQKIPYQQFLTVPSFINTFFLKLRSNNDNNNTEK